MKKIIIILLLFAVNMILAQTLTTSENYVYTKVYLSEDGSKKSQTVQYFDGLGRAKQVVQVKATPLGQDLAVPVTYDDFGRQTKTFLPIPVATGNSAIRTIDENSVNSYYGVANAYSEQKLEASPLGRVLEVANPGTEWAMSSGHTTKMQYLTNTEPDQVKKYNTTASWSNGILTTSISSLSFYTANQLSKSKVTDEDGKITIDFKNSEGKTVLLRKESTSGKLDTYYVYNNYGQLAFVISPKANEKITNNGNTVTSQILDDLCYQYVYDNRFRQVEKKLPGKGWEYMVYDQQNRLVASQDANMKNSITNPNRWSFTRYDQFGRVLYTGVFTGGSRAQEQSNANTKGLNNEARSTSSFTLNGQEIFYTNTAYPSAAFVPYSVNYYDTYPGTNAGNTVVAPFSIFLQLPLVSPYSSTTQNGVSSIRSLKSMPTASMVKNLDDDAWSSTHIWYDRLGRAIGSQGKNHLGGYTKTEKELDFSGAVLSANTFHKRSNSDAEVVINERFIYDNNFRLRQHYHKVNSNAEELLADYTYNELGQVTNKKVGNNLQSIDYTYNIRGAMIKVNDPSNLAGKLFGYELKFASTSNASVAPANYNGNVTEMIWKGAGDDVLKKYSYQYDSYNRLTAALYQEPNSSLPQNGLYNETMSYDSNGNIINLKRNQKGYDGFAEEIDDLDYTYNTGNRLTSVIDHKINYSGYPDTSGNTINYDVNGNMTNHVDKGILEIKYNDLNLPYYVKFNNFVTRFEGDVYRNVSYTYRADGTKIKKIHHYFSGKKQNDAFKTTEYIDGFQYSDEAALGVGSYVLKFFATSEGYFDFANNRYIYHYSDHLGNVRLSFTKRGSVAGIVEQNDYYAFGLKHSSPTIDLSSVNYKYQYNGKELQMETGMYDYGARFYMPDIGRWGVVDPLAEMNTRFSPYHYAANNPMRFIDPDGRNAMDTMMQLGGTWQNVGYGYFNAELGKYIDYEGNVMNAAQVLESRAIINGGGGAGSGGVDVVLQEVIMQGKGNRDTWNNSFNFGFNSAVMGSGILGALNAWNFRINSSTLHYALENTKIGKSIGEAQAFMFLELPMSFAGGELVAAGWRASGIGRYLCGPIGRLTNGIIKICFTEGTLVATENGNKKIENIKEGDLVWSYNEETGKKELKKVVELSRNTSSSLVKISVNGTEITCTPEHPFFVNGNWVEAKNLTKGTLLTTLDGTTSPVKSIKFLDEKVKVYNFEVEDNHNYYVSEKGILVHNTCWPERLARFMEYAGNIEAKSLTSQEATINHLESVFKVLDKTRTDDRILKFVADDMSNLEVVGNGVMKISQKRAGDATFVYPDGGFQIFQKGKLIINKIK